MAPHTFSSSAMLSMTVSKTTLEQDILLALIVNNVNAFQVSIDIKTGKKPVPTELKVLNNSTPLKERCSILRGLCGAALLNALDSGVPYYLLGGHSTPGSPTSAVALASISSWMSVASSKEERDQSFFQALDAHLESRAFLVPACAATVADLDLALTLFGNAQAFEYPNIARWLRQCHAHCQDMAKDAILTPAGHTIQIPAMAVEAPPHVEMPVFFYEYDESAMPKPLQAASAAAAAGGGKQDNDKKGGKQQQQQQQQQGGGKKKEKAAKAPAPAPAAAAAAADFDISALDIRVGKITKVWPHEEADKLYCEEIDIGEESGPRSIASGLRPFYKAEEMQDKMVLVLANLVRAVMFRSGKDTEFLL